MKRHFWWLLFPALLLAGCPQGQKTATSGTSPSAMEAREVELPAETAQEIEARMQAVVKSGSCDEFAEEFAHSRDKESGEGAADEKYCSQLMPQLVDFHLAADPKASAIYESAGVLGVASKSQDGKTNAGDMVLVLDTDRKYKLYDLEDVLAVFAAETGILADFDHQTLAQSTLDALKEKDCGKLAEVTEPPALNADECKVFTDSPRVKDVAAAGDPQLSLAGGNSSWVFYRLETDDHAYTLLFRQKQGKFYNRGIYPYL